MRWAKVHIPYAVYHNPILIWNCGLCDSEKFLVVQTTLQYKPLYNINGRRNWAYICVRTVIPKRAQNLKKPSSLGNFIKSIIGDFGGIFFSIFCNIWTLSLLEQCRTCTFGLAQSCKFLEIGSLWNNNYLCNYNIIIDSFIILN